MPVVTQIAQLKAQINQLLASVDRRGSKRTNNAERILLINKLQNRINQLQGQLK